MKKLLFMLVLAILCNGVARADDSFDGLGAYLRGDYVAALKLWRPLAEQGDVSAQFHLGEMYLSGKGVIQDYKESLRWSQLAAEQGHETAQFILGMMYSRGKGVIKDNKEAAKWFRKAADQGHEFSQLKLDQMYGTGQGLTREDKEEGVSWYRKAAEQGKASAQTNLGFMYKNGNGVQQDYVRAHMWYNLAASNGDKLGVENRDRVAKQMTPAQISKAQDMARECVKKSYKNCD